MSDLAQIAFHIRTVDDFDARYDSGKQFQATYRSPATHFVITLAQISSLRQVAFLLICHSTTVSSILRGPPLRSVYLPSTQNTRKENSTI